MLALCFFTLAGAYSLECFRQLPGDNVLILCLVIGMAAIGHRILRPLGVFACGFAVMGLSASWQLADRLDPGLSGEKIGFSAQIDSFPERDGVAVRFIVRPLHEPRLPQRIRLSWYEFNALPAFGETWRLQVRLRRPRGFANPDGFDFTGWLFRERIGASGFVDDFAPSYRIHGEPRSAIKSARVRIVERLEQLLPADAARGVLLAIGAGARHAIGREQWDLYARTGTSHLMAISGLHIGLAAGSAYVLCWGLLVLVGTRRNVRDVSVFAAILAAAVYATLSGFAVPARRALLMTCIVGGTSLFRRRLRVTTVFAGVCLTIFLSNPLAILAPGFKLSFAAVAVLIVVANQMVSIRQAAASSAGSKRNSGRIRYSPRTWMVSALSWVKALGNLQIALLIGLCPLTVLLFDRFALGAPLLNMIVLPVFNLLTVPLTLGGLLLDGPFVRLGEPLLRWAHVSVELMLEFLMRADSLLSLSRQTRTLSRPMILIALLPILHILLPAGWPGRRLGLLAVAAMLVYKPPSPPQGCLDYRVFDVGQGLAVLLQTARERLLFDTGPAFRTGQNTAELVVLPFLRGQGIDRLDHLVVSHGDLDHAGGVHSILNVLPVRRILVGERLENIAARQHRCVAGMGWTADGVSFSIIHPRIRAPWTRNNSSCVLEVTVGQHRVLLSGDIEAPVETLLAYRGAFRRSNVVLVPHHGSRTSSTGSLVQATQPEIAIIAAGFGNRWGFPKADVVRRWENSGAAVINTAVAGSVSQRLCSGAAPGTVHLERLESRKYWHDVR